MSIRYHFRLPDPANARGDDPRFAFRSGGPEGFAEELQDALRTDALFQRWRAAQDEPDEVDPSLGVTDANATVHGDLHHQHVDLITTTSIPGGVLKHRLRLLAGGHWSLRDVSAG